MSYLLVLEVSSFAACIGLFLNYCIGKPGSEKFSPYEIFSRYTVWLSIKRLVKMQLYDGYSKQLHDSLHITNTLAGMKDLENDFKKVLYDAADPYFTWERAVGMCPICTGFWIALITGPIFTQNFFDLIGIIVFSHLFIRVFNKFL